MRIRRILFFIMAIALLILSPTTVRAEEAEIQEKTEEELAADEEKERADSYAAEADTNKLSGWPQGPKVYADSAVVMDMESGAVLFEKNGDKQHFPASITKLLTTLIALENAELTDTMKFTEDSISFLQYDDAQIGMQAGEELNLDDALHAVLLASANEVSHAVAENVGVQGLGGNYDTFIQKMNERAAELGCTNSHWMNANGLHDDQHYTTAHDMALIASAVYQQEEFRKIMGTLEYKIGPTNRTKEDRVFQQNHKMLWPENYYYYKYCTGGKTGYTDQAKTTLVTMADNGKMHLAAVVLYDYGVDAYTDTKAMFDYVFDNFEKVPVKDKETSRDIGHFNNPESYVVLPKGEDFSQLKKNITLTEDGIRNGKITYTCKGQNVGSASVVLTEDGYNKLSGKASVAEKENTESKQKNISEDNSSELKDNRKPKLFAATGTAVIFLILLGTVLLYRGKKKGQYRK
ncbi:D-alanyl-D-alanine carboxypeptidase family protein [Clostridium sp. C105KSO13]|uniref:D-alanyl-D-alanine carboxypeptidase family protein n=1 Tax=Clostridium sp. C105KSO13 TaxID=1776045 RepID=UPI0007407DBD|nr:D-alanyl-D-alanine carboxypeptidase family protein [Clostridium sp. C105KSO13]CUX26853.1 D-alanyl-D-alanine carboxypeptidase DacB precursor [Clostridium sp. C105KSO13]